MNLKSMTNLRYSIVPYLAPLAPALVSGMALYTYLAGINLSWLFSAFTSVVLGAAIELSGLYVAKGFTNNWQRESWLRMIIAGGGLMIYTGAASFLVWDVYPKLVPVVWLTLFVYLVAASESTYQDDKEDVRQEGNLELELAKQRTAEAKAQASGARAEARQARFQVSGGEMIAETPEIHRGVKSIMDKSDNPQDVDVKFIMQETDLGQTSAYKHKKRYLEQVNGKNGTASTV